MDQPSNRRPDLPPRLAKLHTAVEELIRALAAERNERENNLQAHSEELKKLLLDVVDLNDALERLLASAPESSSDEAANTVLSNMRMLHRRFARLFKVWQIEAIPSVGQMADPVLHKVIDVESHPDKVPEIIVREVQKGYKLRRKVLKQATVVAVTKI
jgi:molecular chaperone GrpE